MALSHQGVGCVCRLRTFPLLRGDLEQEVWHREDRGGEDADVFPAKPLHQTTVSQDVGHMTEELGHVEVGGSCRAEDEPQSSSTTHTYSCLMLGQTL